MGRDISEFYGALEEFMEWAGEEEAIDYAAKNIEGTVKSPPRNIKVIHQEKFMGRPYYIMEYEVNGEREHGCYCEFRPGRFAPIDLQELLPELFKMSPDGYYRIA